MTWLRYALDRILSLLPLECPYDWNDAHLDFDNCKRCRRATQREVRIAKYRAAEQAAKQPALPAARVL